MGQISKTSPVKAANMIDEINGKVAFLDGAEFTGPVILARDPVEDTEPVTKRYYVQNMNMVNVPVRQTVLQGHKNYANDICDFIVAVPGQLKLSLSLNSIPLICTTPNGFDDYGQVDYVFKIDQDIANAWTLPANKSFLQLYIDYNPMTKQAIFGYSELPWGWTYIGSPSVDQHCTDASCDWCTYRWTGSDWEKKYRLPIGECVTGASSVTSLTIYALRGQAKVTSTLAQGVISQLPHNIGCADLFISHYLECIIGENGYAVGDRVYFDGDGNVGTGTSFYGHTVKTTSKVLTLHSSLPTAMLHNTNPAAGPVTITFANWKFGAIVKRAF